MNKPKKHLILCWHGLSVGYETPPFTSGLPLTLCHHQIFWDVKQEFKSLKQVIEWVETIKQPKWAKVGRWWKFQFSICKYR